MHASQLRPVNMHNGFCMTHTICATLTPSVVILKKKVNNKKSHGAYRLSQYRTSKQHAPLKHFKMINEVKPE